MRFIVCVILPLVAWGAPADLTKDASVADESLKPLIRTKRADEKLLFGNHQNEGIVVKKSDPSMHVLDEDNAIDNDVGTAIDDVITKGGNIPDVNALFSDDAQSPGDLDDDDQLLEEDVLPDEALSSANEEGQLIQDSMPMAGEQDGPDEDHFQLDGEKENSSGDMPSELENMIPSNGYKDYRDYYDYLYPNMGLQRVRRSNAKQKRASEQENLISPKGIMESAMTSGQRANERVKRDLTADELYDWLENGDPETDDAPSMGYYPEYPEIEDVGSDNALSDQLLKELLTGEQEQEEYPIEQENSADYPAYEEYGTEEPKENPELLSLLEYLVENEEPAEEVNPLREMYPADIEEKWEDLDLGPDVTYQPIIYQGVPGIFIPMNEKMASQEVSVDKRQYLSMVPGMRKRGFYPYNSEPEDGRWGAFVPPEERKRAADAYERLFRLAEALKPQERSYADYK